MPTRAKKHFSIFGMPTKVKTKSYIEISIDDARRIVKEVYGIDISSNLSINQARDAIDNLLPAANYSPQKNAEFISKAFLVNLK